MHRPWKRVLLLSAAAGLLLACTMPLPYDLEPTASPTPGGSEPDGSAPEGSQTQVVPLDQIFIRSGTYNSQTIRYLDINHCTQGDPDCAINRLNTPLSILIRYDFFFSDGSPVIGQNPVFNAPRSKATDTPFRQVIRVIVPDGYKPNTIRSSQDVAVSQFRTESSNRVLNNPLIRSGETASLPLTIGKAWQQNREVAYLDLGSVPYSPVLNQPGWGFVYFLRNHDKSDLPAQPAPIFDSIPGELLYSPIRKVFRAVAEEQISSLGNDPSLGIRSLEELLKAVNQGVFKLEETSDFFNYPYYQAGQSPVGLTYKLSLAAARDFPPLPEGSYYALWVVDQLNQARLLLRFRAEGGNLTDLDGGLALASGEAAPAFFHFSETEVGTFRHFLVSIEKGDIRQPTGSTLLEASYEAHAETELDVPFASSYRSLQTGSYLLAAPTSRESNLHGSGIWFVQRSDGDSAIPPLNRNLDPGLIMSLPPRGWTYNGWVLTDLRNPIWLQTGHFRAVNQPDQQQRYGDRDSDAYAFPGEDFLTRAPEGLFFPLDLTSTGERELVVSLEPESLNLRQPFFRLYRTVLAKGTPELTNQPLPVSQVNFPILRLKLEKE
ncbi:MAG TPA: hypothetical protein V6D23_13990 [Candidatus Obscuribacterales bacterium]